MPRPLPILPMSFDEFERMEHRLGWKHEYWDGAARLSPQESAVVALRLPLDRPLPVNRPPLNGGRVRLVCPDDEAALVELFVRTFDDAIEFAGWPETDYHRHARESTASFFGLPSGSRAGRSGRRDASFLIEIGTSVLGAVLVRSADRGPIVEPIMVDAAHRRGGLATALLAASIESLRSHVEAALFSRCHLGNAASVAWHAANGFEEIPGYFVALHRWRHFASLARHSDSAGQSHEAERMRVLAEQWRASAESLRLERWAADPD
jgi:GNAT superfamily N-acetyltransferase